MSLTYLRASLALWSRRLAYRRRQHAKYHDPANPHPDRKALAVKWHKSVDEAERNIARREQQIAAKSGPQIITSAQLGLRFAYVFGEKGSLTRGAWHYTAGARRANAAALAAEMRADHAYHISKGWGGGSYEAMIADDGTIGFLNPVDRKSAGVAGHNTGLVNICCPGTTGDRLTLRQRESVRWLKANWHTTRVPKAYRLPRSAGSLSWRGHHEYPGNPTACPGAMLGDYKECWR